jgi:hypothetical protein
MQSTIHNTTLVSNVAQDNPGSLNMLNTYEALSTGHLLNVCTHFSPLDHVSIVSILYMQFRGYVMNACNASWRAQVLD